MSMKTIGAIFLLLFISNVAAAQTAYLQVSGEAGLQVYINDQFKCTTTTELGGCIIENIRAGIITVKVVKSGYVPYEEKVTIKPGEVLLYKVKPFSKNKVFVSESGNTEVADTKKVIETGTLIVQSVPINILITILEVDDIDDKEKTKDIWKAENISTGLKTVIFEYNSKLIEKKVEILDKRNTQVFVNMLNGEVKVTNSIEEKHRFAFQQDFLKALADEYGFKPGLHIDDFLDKINKQHAERLRSYLTVNWGVPPGVKRYEISFSKRTDNKLPYLYLIDANKSRQIVSADYSVFISNNQLEAKRFYEQVKSKWKEDIEERYLQESANFLTIVGENWKSNTKTDTWLKTGFNVAVRFHERSKGWYEVSYNFFNWQNWY